MISWDNRYKWTKIRTLVSWVVVIMCLVGSYLLFGYIQYKQSTLNSKYNYSIDCTVLYPSVNLNVYNATLAASSP